MSIRELQDADGFDRPEPFRKPLVSNVELKVAVTDAAGPIHSQCGICPSRDRIAVIRFGDIAFCLCRQHELVLKEALDRRAMMRTAEHKQVGQRCKVCGGKGAVFKKVGKVECGACKGTGTV